MLSLRCCRNWIFALEYSVWSAAWAAAASVVRGLSPNLDGAVEYLSWAVTFPMLVQALLAWGSTSTAPTLAPYFDWLSVAYASSGDPSVHLPAVLFSLFFPVLPMILATAVLSHALPAFLQRLPAGASAPRQGPRLWQVCLLAFGIASLCLVWPFLGLATYFEEQSRIGYELAIPPVIDQPALSDYFQDILWLLAFVGVPFMAGPLLPILLRRGLMAACRRLGVC